MRLRDLGHRAGGLADRQHDRPFGVGQMRGQHPFRVAGVDPSLEHPRQMCPHRALAVGRARR